MAATGSASGDNSSIRLPSARRPGLFNELHMVNSFAGLPGRSFIKVGIEDSDFGDAIDRELAAVRRTANRLRRGPVVHAEGPFFIRAHVRVNPRDLVAEIAFDHRQTGPGTILVNGNQQSVRKLSLNYIAGHDLSSWLASRR